MNLDKFHRTDQPRRSPIKFQPPRLPGQSLDEKIQHLSERFDAKVLLGFTFILLTIFEWYRWLADLRPDPWPLTFVTLFILPFIVWASIKYRREKANHKLGLEGERTVGHVLEELRAEGYQVFHDIPGTDFNIDHVIVGPAGIFTIETKTRSKPTHGNPQIIYDGDTLRSDEGWDMDEILVQARAQASWLTNLLNQSRRTKCTVWPVVLFPGWYVKNIAPNEKRDLWVLNEKAFPYFLAQEPEILSPETVDGIANSITQYCQLSGTPRQAVA